ncbi:uncharacterized protein LOC130892787 [Diorhabda carinulata]|uniref:uncharacterized protein LOC130892787 n=1 Tax=Diorhabda carinulata TaxID=1163345 RepID=UPI0025A010B6|nr:uncharacterized protein LOC130892787 [Diorhabda carinulata]
MDIRFESGFSLKVALQIAYSDKLPVDTIYIEPPEPSSLTDEETGNEDYDDCNIDRCSGFTEEDMTNDTKGKPGMDQTKIFKNSTEDRPSEEEIKIHNITVYTLCK